MHPMHSHTRVSVTSNSETIPSGLATRVRCLSTQPLWTGVGRISKVAFTAKPTISAAKPNIIAAKPNISAPKLNISAQS
ncbi:hypothetical protein BC938DRAFT_474994 [Jimgerdemannia flammicorona]|uniref:Uncharacterized protein n=1 Tax=Jimgerdemannia flammicorona TaxID=994334 RepID=A0A433Q152_9FUNG|nr:hypothetical protein BC938DRAFT_474994 [Jimgerdemannia flammicorona]